MLGRRIEEPSVCQSEPIRFLLPAESGSNRWSLILAQGTTLDVVQMHFSETYAKASKEKGQAFSAAVCFSFRVKSFLFSSMVYGHNIKNC